MKNNFICFFLLYSLVDGLRTGMTVMSCCESLMRKITNDMLYRKNRVYNLFKI